MLGQLKGELKMMTIVFMFMFVLAMFGDVPNRDAMIITSGLFAIAAAIEMGISRLSKK